MGLSNEERYEKMVWGVRGIVSLQKDLLENRYETGKLPELIDKLWYTLLGKVSNGAYWLMGGALADDHIKPSLIGVAFAKHRPERTNDCFDDIDEDKKTDAMRYFEWCRYAQDNQLSMAALLSKDYNGKARAAVAKTFLWTEAIAYGLCRYHDDFMDSFEDFNCLLRKIQGECFDIMQRDNSYCHAWMVEKLCDKLVTYDEKDIVNKIWHREHLQHKVSVVSNKFEERFHMFRKTQFKQLKVPERFELTLELVDDSAFEHESVCSSITQLVKNYNDALEDNASELKLNSEKLTERLKKAADNKEEKKQEHYPKDCDLTGNYLDNKGEISNWRFRDNEED